MDRNQKLLLWIHGAYGLAATMSGLFLNLYLWRVSNDMVVNATFMLGSFLFGPLAFWVGGVIAKKKDRLLSYQLGIGTTAIFYMIVVILQENVASMAFFMGILNGLSSGMYWLGFLVILYDIVETKNRSAFLGKQMAVLGTVNTLGPAFAGVVISQFSSLLGYNIIFGLSICLFLCGVILSLRLPKDTSPKRNLRIPLVFRMNRRFLSMKKMWSGWILWGACEGLIMFLPMILLFESVSKEYLVGFITILLGLLAIGSSLWHSRYNNFERHPKTVLVSWSIYSLAMIPLLLNMNFYTVLLFLVVNEISKALIGVSFFGYMLRIVELLPKRAGLRTEMMVMREWTLNIGRILSVIIFIVCYQYVEGSILTVLFLTIIVQGLLYPIMRNGKVEIEENTKVTPIAMT